MDDPRFVTVEDYEPVARELLPDDVYGYFAGGAGDERNLAENVRAFERWLVRPRYLRGASTPDTSTEVLGAPLSFPVMVAPWAYHSLAHPDGERATARAADQAGTAMVVSGTVFEGLEDLRGASRGPMWWQLYVYRDRARTADLLAQVVAAGFGAVMWTIDWAADPMRHRDTRTGFVMPIGLESGMPFDLDMTWDDLAWVREHAPGLPVLVKGVLTAEDARLALAAGVDGIVVSNHGGRQIDRAPAAVDALPEVVEAVGGRVPVLMDGGVRTGTDVVVALALGARAVMIGRPTIWGLAVAGEQGVVDVLRMLREGFANTMAFTGCRSVTEIDRSLVMRAPDDVAGRRLGA
jgi:isopentenyl diphosphate isomerase/L-lactate dehydrogenase-like FMN-dependent dehydrogenase